jgi:prevent-host-death family protein
MPKTLSATEAKRKFDAVMDSVEKDDEVIVEALGKPKAVVIPFSRYENMLELEERARFKDALADLEKLSTAFR